MIRDPGPIHSIGHSVTSRDVPTTGEETEGISPNSGIISRAVNGNPIVSFLASSAATMATAFVASKLVKSGGLKLAKTIQDRHTSDPGGYATSIVKNVTDLRRHLDELQGLTRFEGDRAYRELVWEDKKGKLTTGIDFDGRLQETNGLGFLTATERAKGANDLLSEPAAIWSFRDTLQQKMVRAGRRLPYELPAFYAAQRSVVDTLFGEKTVEENKVNWSNPVDVITDFTKQSMISAATMILPFEFAGAGVNQARSSLHTVRHSIKNLDRLSPIEQKMHKGFVELDAITQRVGISASSLQERFLRTSAQASGALSAVSDPYRNRQGFVQNLHALRHGREQAIKNINDRRQAGEAVKDFRFTDLFSSNKMASYGQESVMSDLLPGFAGLSSARKQFLAEWKLHGDAFDVLAGTKTFDDVIAPNIVAKSGSASGLNAAMERIAGMSNSRLLSAAGAIGNAEPGKAPAFFLTGRQQDAFKRILEQRVTDINKTLDKDDVRRFVNNLRINQLTDENLFHPTQIISMGRVKNYGVPGASNFATSESFFDNLLKRYSTISKDTDFLNKFTAKDLHKAVTEASGQFKSERTAISENAFKAWDTIASNHLGSMGAKLAGKQKLSYLSFKTESSENTAALARSVAETLGIPTSSLNGMRKGLAERGIDPDNFIEMRSFLLRNRKMSSGIFSRTQQNVMGQKVTVNDILGRDKLGNPRDYKDLDAGLKRIVSEQQFNGLTALVNSTRAGGSALGSSLDNVAISGLYRNTQNSGAQYFNYSGIKSGFTDTANFFMNEFRIPILGFNPFNLFGKSSFNAMANSAPVQYLSGRSVQPFLDDLSEGGFGVFVKTSSTKGKIIRADVADNAVTNTEVLAGTYRPIASSSNELLSRYARASSGISGASPYDVRADIQGRGLTTTEKVKKFFNVDIDQPDSIGGFVKRFRGRHFDVQNPTTLTKLLRGDEIVRFSGGRKQILVGKRLPDGRLQIVDKDTKNVIRTVSEQDIFKGMDLIRRTSNQYGVPSQVIKKTEEVTDFFSTSVQVGGKTVNLSDVRSPQQLMDYVEALVKAEKDLFPNLSKEQINQIAASQSRIQNIVKSRNMSALSVSSEKSPTLTTVADEIRTAVFKHRLSTETILRSSGKQDPFEQLGGILDDMLNVGAISSAQRAETKASVFGAMQDAAAFQSYRINESVVANATNAFNTLLSNKEAFKAFSEPYANNAVAGISGSVRKRLAPLNSLTNGYFSTAKHSLDDYSTDQLGSGQPTTFVPTFGTVFSKDPRQALLSVAGINTYKNPSGYSSASSIMAHGVGRLNKYFGSAGVGLGDGYSGPLSEFAMGMVFQRVLPAYIAAQTFITADRTAGGFVNDTDADGERIYSPLVMGAAARGAVEVQSVLSGMIPGGLGYQDRRDQLLEGEVAIRQGRYWPLGVTPFKGGKIEYYRPSYYRRMQAGALYTDDTYGSPVEKFLFYNDVSPLRPFDPYRFEKKHYEDRPYPVSGEYFTGPFGPITTLANMTIGKVLKPKVLMHQEEVQAGLANYVPTGQFGAYDASAYGAARQQPTVPGPSLYGSPGAPGGFSGIAGMNSELASRAGPTGMASGMVRGDMGAINAGLVSMAYGPPKMSGVMTPSIIPAGAPISQSSYGYQAGEFGYRAQEMAGIYGFAFGNVREMFGFGEGDLTPQRSVLQSAGRAYGSSRGFWDLNLGGLGDVPLPSQEGIGNLEFSEVVRRFIPKERTDVDFINPIRNAMADQYPFLPGAEYFTNFQTGDPYTKVQEGELRLPGIGYERLNRLYGDVSGEYGAVTQFDILGDVAPYSKQFRSLDRQMDTLPLSPDERIKVQEVRDQVQSRTEGQFSEYTYKGSSAQDMGLAPNVFRLRRIGEAIAHSDNFLINKAIGDKTAVEDWERKNVYGSTFPQWQNPISSFISPMVNKATQDNPLVAATGLAVMGTLFGSTPRAKAFGAATGAITGAAASIYGNVSEMVTGQRYIPEARKQELALEEYVDILSYVKNSRLANMAQRSGDFSSAVQFRRQAQSTMYGADLNNINTQMLQYAVPKRKREHFQQMIQETDSGERKRILSTAGRLERRIYQAAWGMRVEKRPELDEYFERHELPDENWEGWHPNTNMDHVKIKMGQSMGIDMSQMGYYPQQLKQANLSNPSYPNFFADQKSEDMFLKLKSLMSGTGVSGSVIPVPNTFGRQDINVSYGVNYG